MWLKVRTDRDSVGKYDIVRDVLQKANKRADSGLTARREVIKRVVEFEEFSTCWPKDVYKAKSNVADLRKIVQAKDAFTRIKQERDRPHEENVSHARAEKAAIIAKRKKIEEVRDRLNALFGMNAEPQKRGKLLEGAVISECTNHLNNKTMILSSVKEFVMLLMSERDLVTMLRRKVNAALVDKKPFREVLA